MKAKKKIEFKRICPDCKKTKHLLRHHIITNDLAKYLIEVGGFDKGSIMNLRNQLRMEICKDCENKFHTFGKHIKEKDNDTEKR